MRRHGLGTTFIDRMISALIPSISWTAAIKILLVLFVLLTGVSAAVGPASISFADEGRSIPQDAIRIRIIANSDTSFDQQVKRDVRDQVADLIGSWGAMPDSHDEAYALIQTHLAEIEKTANDSLEAWGVLYRATVDLAQVPFPDKVFQGRAYTAGNYEALRITLGGGEGVNWWCVLFPPLCLTAATAAGDEAKKSKDAVSDATSKAGGSKPGKGAVKASDKKVPVSVDAADENKPEAKFFVWEMLKGQKHFFTSLFS